MADASRCLRTGRKICHRGFISGAGGEDRIGLPFILTASK
jgi:hypothetical protein